MPVTIKGKLILRELTTQLKKETNTPKDMWDRLLLESRLPKWDHLRDSLCNLQDVCIQRCYQPPNSGKVKRREVHILCDTSQLAIGAVAYLSLMNEHSQSRVSLLLAIKARVTPLHAVSMPRLELCAAVLATTLS